jgi:hypothetical protein
MATFIGWKVAVPAEGKEFRVIEKDEFSVAICHSYTGFTANSYL